MSSIMIFNMLVSLKSSNYTLSSIPSDVIEQSNIIITTWFGKLQADIPSELHSSSLLSLKLMCCTLFRTRRVTASTVFLKTLTASGITTAFVNLGSDHPALLEAFGDFAVREENTLDIVTCPSEVSHFNALMKNIA